MANLLVVGRAVKWAVIVVAASGTFRGMTLKPLDCGVEARATW